MKFAIATVAFWEALGYDTANWRKSNDGNQAITELKYAEILGVNLAENPGVKIYFGDSPELLGLLESAAWHRDGTNGPFDSYNLLEQLAEVDTRLTTAVAEVIDGEVERVAAEDAREVTYNALVADVQANVDAFDVALEDGIIAENLAVKLAEKEATYAPRLTTAEQQLEQKVGDGVKAEPEDLSATTLGLVTGTGGPINLLSVPQDKSVAKAKLDDNLRTTLFQYNSISFTKLSGYYASGIFYPTGSQWDSAYVACTPGDMFAVTLFSMEAANMPIATYYDAGGAVVSYSEKSFGAKTDYVLTMPAGCYNFSISGRNDQGVTMGIKKLEPNDTINNSKSLLGSANINDGVLTIPKLAQTIQDGLFKYVEIKPAIKKGYYTNGVLTSSLVYDSVFEGCKPGDKFKVSGYILAASAFPLATFYDSGTTKVSDTGVVTVDTAFDDFIITVPDGCYNFSVSSRNDRGVALKIKKLQSEYYGYYPLYPDIKQGYYVNGVFYASPQNDSIFVSGNPGDKFLVTAYLLGAVALPLATFYNQSSAKVSDTGAVTVDTAFTDYEITMPEGCYYFSTSARNDKGVALSVKKYGNSVAYKKKPLTGLKCLVFGDSISAVAGRWRNQFYNITGMSEIACKAVAGAHLADYVDTVLDGVTFTGSGNTVNNQIQAILNTPVATPDVIIISAITNDTLTDTQLNTETEVFVSGTSYIDIATVDRTTIEGSMRWQVEKLYALYPNVKIFYASAIQAVESTRTAKSIIAKEKKLIRIAEKMSVNVIKAGTGSGIYGRYEVNGANGKHLEDGLHPNELGGRVLGNYYATSVLSEMLDKSYSL